MENENTVSEEIEASAPEAEVSEDSSEETEETVVSEETVVEDSVEAPAEEIVVADDSEETEAASDEDADLLVPAPEVSDEDQDAHDASFEDEEVDWFMLDHALTGLLADKALTTEERKELPDEAFCGPERSFPVHDCAHYTAALRLIGRYKGPGSSEKIRACVMRKGKEMGCVKEEDSKDCGCTSATDELAALKEDYANALKEIEKLKAAAADKLDNTDASSEDNEKEVLTQEDAEATIVVEEVIEDSENFAPSVVENPGACNTEGSRISNRAKELGDFEQGVLNKWSQIKDEHGVNQANAYIVKKIRLGHLPKDFDPNILIKE